LSPHIFRATGDAGDGLEFIGHFDELYIEDADPWGQSGMSGEMASYYAESRKRVRDALDRHRNGYRGGGLEIGCGHGHTLPGLQKSFGGHWSGLDISPAAIRTARRLYPSFTFYAGDIGGELPFPPSSVGKYDAVILSQLLWYILDRFDAAVGNALRLCAPGGLLVVTQAFLRGKQLYGAEIADGFRGALQLFQMRFPDLALIEAQYDDTTRHAHHDGLLIFRKARHAE
jgi:SAM-dependent methyltransferase